MTDDLHTYVCYPAGSPNHRAEVPAPSFTAAARLYAQKLFFDGYTHRRVARNQYAYDIVIITPDCSVTRPYAVTVTMQFNATAEEVS